MVKCEICEKKLQDLKGLSNHIRVHKIISKEYYDKFLKKEGEDRCIECGKETKFRSIIKGYCRYCSYVCVGMSNKIKEKKKQTCMKNYGVENPLYSKEIKEKSKQTCLKKYGVACSLQAETVKEKSKQTNIKKYGAANPFQSEEIKNKIKQTNVDKYGVEYITQVKEIKDKIKQTMLKKYNVTNPNHLHITNLDKYNDVRFIKENFLTDKRYVKITEMIEFFNVTKAMCYQHIKSLNIEYNRMGGTSHYEQEIYDFLRYELGILNIFQNTKQVIAPLELDFFLPDYKLAIEFDGIFWHSEQQGKGINYHLNKTIACEGVGVQLVHIFENEWVQKGDIIKSILKAKLGKLKKLCGARQTIIKEIISKESSPFFNKNHRQGSSPSSLKLGAFYKEGLVAVMTFSKPSIAKGRKDNNSLTNYELTRFATMLGYNIPGMASKFLAYFKNNYLFDSLLTFADRRYSDGTFYKKLGFNLTNTTRPCYWYFKNGSIDLKHRFKFRKSELNRLLDNFNPNLTEYQNMIENGFDRIFDCGNYRFVLKTKPIS